MVLALGCKVACDMVTAAGCCDTAWPGCVAWMSFEPGCQGRWICSLCCDHWKSSSVASLLDRAAIRFTLLGTLLLERKAFRMGYGVGMKLLVFPPSPIQTRGVVQDLDVDQAPTPSSANAASPSSPSHLLAVLTCDIHHVDPEEVLCSCLSQLLLLLL